MSGTSGTGGNLLARARARWHRGRPLALIDVAVTDAEAVLAELGTSAPPEELREMGMSQTVLDVCVRNRGDRVQHVRSATLRLSTDSGAPAAVGEGAARRGSDPSRTRPAPLRPSTAYRVQVPPREGSYRHGLRQVIDPGETDRFLISLVTPHDGEGARTYAVTLELDCGTTATGPVLSTSASVRVRV